MVAWARAIYQYHVNGKDTVGRSVDARGPVDHASVGLTQAHPNKSVRILEASGIFLAGMACMLVLLNISKPCSRVCLAV